MAWLLLELREIEDLWKEEIEEFSPSINLQSPFPWGWIPGKNSPSQLLLVVPNGMWGIPARQGRDKSQFKDGDRPTEMVPHCWSSQGEFCCSPSTSQGGFIGIIHFLRGFGTKSLPFFSIQCLLLIQDSTRGGDRARREQSSCLDLGWENKAQLPTFKAWLKEIEFCEGKSSESHINLESRSWLKYPEKGKNRCRHHFPRKSCCSQFPALWMKLSRSCQWKPNPGFPPLPSRCQE